MSLTTSRRRRQRTRRRWIPVGSTTASRYACTVRGVNTDQGGGVSWSYILRNKSLTLLIRKSPLGGIVAQARMGSECLWRLTPRRALDELGALLRRMWARLL